MEQDPSGVEALEVHWVELRTRIETRYGVVSCANAFARLRIMSGMTASLVIGSCLLYTRWDVNEVGYRLEVSVAVRRRDGLCYFVADVDAGRYDVVTLTYH